jgi:hypothetical protein
MRTLAATLLLALAACCSAPSESGIRIGDKTLEQFKAGKTTEPWVLAVLGPPTSSANVEGEDDVHVLRYSLVQEHGGFFASLFGSASSTSVSTIYFIVRKGVVDSFWADRAQTPGLFGGGETPGEKKD